MTQRPSDRQLDRLLAGLPRVAASPEFRRRVLADLDARRPARAHRAWLLAAAAASAAALALGLWLQPRAARHRPETRALVEEHRLLMEELESLKASLRDSQQAPVLYLGGDETVELVLDLEPVWHEAAAGDARPAAYRGAERPRPASDRQRGDRR